MKTGLDKIEARAKGTETHSRNFGGVTVYVNDGSLGGDVGATINWSAIGSVSADEAERFAGDMRAAVEYARAMDVLLRERG